MDRDATRTSVPRSDEAQASTFLIRGESFLLVARRLAASGRLDPDLQEMHRRARLRVEFAVPYAGARAHALHVARPDDRAVAHAVLMLQFPGQDIANDFHVPVAMCPKALAGLNP